MSRPYRFFSRFVFLRLVSLTVISLVTMLLPMQHGQAVANTSTGLLPTSGQAADTTQTKGIVRSVPLLGIGIWSIQTDSQVTRTVRVDLNTHLLKGVPPAGSWVRVEGRLQLGGLLLATRIVPDDYEPGQVVVRLAEGVLASTIASRYGLISPGAPLFAGDQVYLFATPGLYDNVEQLLTQLKSDTNIIWSELVYIDGMPEGDPYRTWGWGGTDPSGYTNQAAFEQVNLAPALAAYQGDEIVVAVLDTGIDLNHPAFTGRLVPGWDVVALDAEPQDEGPGFGWGHGTHAAGIIAKIAPQSKLMPVRVLDPNGRGNTVKLALGIEWAAQHGAHVLNVSLGTTFHSFLLREVIERAQAKGVVVVAAAGNRGENRVQYPAGYAGVIGVTAVDAANVKADFANYGAGWVDLAAPGVGITSTIVGPHGSGYASWSGTSMATPFVSGAAALARQKFPSVPPAAIADLLQTTAVPLDAANPGYAGQVGALLDIGAALVPDSQAAMTPSATNEPTTVLPQALPAAPDSATAPIPDANQSSVLHVMMPLAHDSDQRQVYLPIVGK